VEYIGIILSILSCFSKSLPILMNMYAVILERNLRMCMKYYSPKNIKGDNSREIIFSLTGVFFVIDSQF